MDVFNEGPSFGEGADITSADNRDVAGLLVEYIVNMKDHLLPLSVNEALFEFAVEPTCRREAVARAEYTRDHLARRPKYTKETMPDPGKLPASWNKHLIKGPVIWIDDDAKTKNDEMENKYQIPVAAALLRFIPSSHMSLLDYLMTFFMKTIATPGNKMEAKDIARMFGYRIVGGLSKRISRVTLLWLLKRWTRIADLIFNKAPEALKHGYKRYYPAAPMSAPIEEQLASIKKIIDQLTSCRKGKSKRISILPHADRTIGLREADKEKDDGQIVERASFSSKPTDVDDDVKGVKKRDIADLSALNLRSQGTDNVKLDEEEAEMWRQKTLALLTTSTIDDDIEVDGELVLALLATATIHLDGNDDDDRDL